MTVNGLAGSRPCLRSAGGDARHAAHAISKGGAAAALHPERDLPFFALFEADPNLAEHAEETLAAELGR